MALKIITNNPKVYDYCLKNRQNTEFFHGHAKDLLLYTRNFLFKEFRLAADPLGGYLSRPNPYHTVFLQNASGSEIKAEDVIRIETSVNQWYKYTNITEMTRQLDIQYQELDFSIAINTLEGLLKNPLYHTHG